MNICTGTCRPVADDSLTNESRVGSLKFEDAVSNFSIFGVFCCSSSKFLSTNIHQKVVHRVVGIAGIFSLMILYS